MSCSVEFFNQTIYCPLHKKFPGNNMGMTLHVLLCIDQFVTVSVIRYLESMDRRTLTCIGLTRASPTPDPSLAVLLDVIGPAVDNVN